MHSAEGTDPNSIVLVACSFFPYQYILSGLVWRCSAVPLFHFSVCLQPSLCSACMESPWIVFTFGEKIQTPRRGGGEMAQWLKGLLCKPNLSSIPRTHVKVAGENQRLRVVFWPLHVVWYIRYVCPLPSPILPWLKQNRRKAFGVQLWKFI